MKRFRRHRAGVLALVCIGIGVVLMLLAFDASAWRRTVAHDDLRFRALPSHRGLWKPATTLPGDPAAALLGTGDTITYRRALQHFWYSRIGSNPEERQDLPTLRADTQNRLLELTAGGRSARERSFITNLLGVLVVTTPTSQADQAAVEQILRRSAGYFQQAIELDPTNLDAKMNLEMVLRLTRPGRGKFGKDARAGYGFGRGRAVTPAGNGY